jgi:hypothetical protein
LTRTGGDFPIEYRPELKAHLDSSG